jgi:hypothetical protein
MDEHEDIKPVPTMLGNSVDPVPAGDPKIGESQPGQATPEPGIELARTGIELASVEAPSIAPTTDELTAAAVPASGAIDARKIEPPLAAEKFEGSKPKSADSSATSREVIPLAVLVARARASRRFSRFTWLAAAVVLAAAFGATAGVLGASGLARLAGESAPAEPPADLQRTITQLRSDIAALKAGVDATSRNISAQYSKLAERFDRVERAQPVAPKSDAALPKEANKETTKEANKEITGSVTPPSVTAAPAPPAGIVPGWAVRDVYRGVAMLQSRLGGMVEVEPGDVLPSLGRIESIRRQDGRWVVMTSRGMITSMR